MFSLQQLLPASLAQQRLHKKVFMKFAERNGLIYFGTINQRFNEHRLVRGVTLAKAHRDDHYCLGSTGGYDVTFLERTSQLVLPGAAAHKQTWLIASFDLHHSRDMPHFFVGNISHSQAFYHALFTKFPYLMQLDTSFISNAQFRHKKTLYGALRDEHKIKTILNDTATTKINSTFGSLTFEVYDNILYLYAEHQRPSTIHLKHMLDYGLWLSKHIDATAK